MLLCTAVVLLGITVPPALAAGGPYYPVSVEEYTSGPLDELRINKVYQLSLSDDPSAIPTADFERDGRRYYLLDLIQEDDVGVDTRDYTDTITQDSDTKDLSVILKQLFICKTEYGLFQVQRTSFSDNVHSLQSHRFQKSGFLSQ